jgi:probable FeS assembly SUF system protein SufT
MNEPITLGRDCEALEIPSGIGRRLPMGTVVRISQSLGGSYTVTDEQGKRYRVEGRDADSLGLAASRAGVSRPAVSAGGGAAQPERCSEEAVWGELKSVFDPEIPVNIVDLGLIYSCAITPLQDFGNRIEIKMTLTAPGCGMAGVLKEDVERKLARLPGVREVSVEVVFDPPWEPGRMSEAAKLQLGLDLDSGDLDSGGLDSRPGASVLPIWKPGR